MEQEYEKMFNNCIYEFVCEQSCADRHCVRGCDYGADVVDRNHDCSCLVTVSVTVSEQRFNVQLDTL